MRMTLPCVLVLAACGGSSPRPATMPANIEPSKPVVAKPAPVAPDTSVCADHPDELGPYVLTADQASRRYGLGATRYGDAPTTKDRPIEVCGIPAQQTWLTSARCADGSKAFASPGQVPASRRGNVGPGGRCGAIVDLYVAKCPEGEYEVHMDMYMCGPGESFM